MNADALEQAIGYRFSRRELLRQALTHRSFSAQHNERLEFLGDSLLNCAVALLLYDAFPTLTEGALSRLRANLVCQQSLADIAVMLQLGKYLQLGDGEQKSGGRNRPSILADACESLLGAIFLDGGFDAARQTVARLYADSIDAINPEQPAKDAKTRLQEYLQGERLPLPDYTLGSTSGQAHEQTFHVECSIPALSIVTRGSASSRRAAEQAAADAAWQLIQQQPSRGTTRRRAP